MKLSILLLAVASGLLLTACSNPPADAKGGANQADYEELSACADSVCDAGFAQRIEEGDPGGMHDMECIVQAMRDRKPGFYRVLLDWTFSNGSKRSSIDLVLDASGGVSFGVHRTSEVDYLDGEGETDVEETWEPTERCTLKPPAFFEACLAAIAADGSTPADDPFDCIYRGASSQDLPWFESCEEQPFTCE